LRYSFNYNFALAAVWLIAIVRKFSLMKQSNLFIGVPSPCSEDWEAMSPCDRGRHCAVCSKTVVDFTLMSDGQILDVFSKAGKEPPCGHFLETQLNRKLTDTRYRPSFMGIIAGRAAAALLFLQGLATGALAQQAGKHPPVTKQAAKHKPHAKDNTRRIKGKILDSESNMPVAGAVVQVQGTGMHTITDSAGAFTLIMPDSFSDTQVVIKATAPGSKGTPEDPYIKDMTVNSAAIATARSEIILYMYVPHTLPQHDVIIRDMREIRTLGGAPVSYQQDQPLRLTG